MTWAKPTIQGKAPLEVWRLQDMTVVWRADGSFLYKSDRLKHYMRAIEPPARSKTSAVLTCIHLMLYDVHNKEYPTSGVILGTLGPNIVYNWNSTVRKYDISLDETHVTSWGIPNAV